jgi:hypothetical protein
VLLQPMFKCIAQMFELPAMTMGSSNQTKIGKKEAH